MATRIYDLFPDRWSVNLVFGRDTQAKVVCQRLIELAPDRYATSWSSELVQPITRPTIILNDGHNARSKFSLVKTIRSKTSNQAHFMVPITMPRMATRAMASITNIVVLCHGLSPDDLRNICNKRTSEMIRFDALCALYEQHVNADNVLVLHLGGDDESVVYRMSTTRFDLIQCPVAPTVVGPPLHTVIPDCSITVVLSRDRRRVHGMLHDLTRAYERKPNHLVHYLDMQTDNIDNVVLSVSGRWTNVLLLDNVPCSADRFNHVRDTLRNLIQNTKTIVVMGVQFEAPTICDFVRRRNRNYARGYSYNVIMGPEMTRTGIYTRMGLPAPPDIQIDKYDWDFCACTNDYADCLWRMIKHNDEWPVVEYSDGSVPDDVPNTPLTNVPDDVSGMPSNNDVSDDVSDMQTNNNDVSDVPSNDVPTNNDVSDVPVSFSLPWRDRDNVIIGRTRFDGNVQLFQRGTVTESDEFVAESDWFQQPAPSIFTTIFRSIFG